MTVSEITSIVAVVIAGLSFIISAAAFVNSIRARKPKLVVGISDGTLEWETYDEEFGAMKEGEQRFFLDIANPSERRVKINAFWIEWGKRKEIYPDFQASIGTPQEPPFVLPPGDSAGYSTPTDDLTSWLRSEGARKKVRVRARVIDALGKKYLSRKLSFSIPPRSKR